MMKTPDRTDQQDADDFVRAANQPQPGLLREFWDFLRTNKKWWIAPIIIFLLLLSALVVVLNSAWPFIYPVF